MNQTPRKFHQIGSSTCGPHFGYIVDLVLDLNFGFDFGMQPNARSGYFQFWNVARTCVLATFDFGIQPENKFWLFSILECSQNLCSGYIRFFLECSQTTISQYFQFWNVARSCVLATFDFEMYPEFQVRSRSLSLSLSHCLCLSRSLSLSLFNSN